MWVSQLEESAQSLIETTDSHRQSILFTAWMAVLLTSNLAVILWRELASGEPLWWPWVHVIGLFVIFSATLLVTHLRPLRRFLIILITIFLLGFGGGWEFGLIPFIRNSSSWINWTAGLPILASELATHLLRLVPACVILIILFGLGLKRADFFLIKGDIDAPVEPSRLLGMKKPEPWTRIGTIFAIVFAVFTLIFLFGSWGIPSSPTFDLVTIMPLAVIIATMNAFNEEFTLRAAPLSVLWEKIGKQQALLITTVYFGLGHFYGVPNGVLGILLSGFLGWFLGKSLLETRGFFWAWLIHFLPDVFIFTFFLMAI
jgi:membrane protease YdiL (CAAX protease family)